MSGGYVWDVYGGAPGECGRCSLQGVIAPFGADGECPVHPEPVTEHTNLFNRPDIGLIDAAQWCGVCRCWDNGLIESADGSMYVHPQHRQLSAT